MLNTFVHSVTQTFVVVIKDVNDNIPTFAIEIYDFVIDEEFNEDELVGCMPALDKDSSQNGKITYSIYNTTHSDSFYMDDIGCIRTSRISIDIDQTLRKDKRGIEINLFITASDNGLPKLQSSAIAKIVVLDINDNNPIFEQNNVTESILETIPIGALVTKVSAVDADLKDTLSYEIISGNEKEKFSLNKNNGFLTVKGTLDFNVSKQYVLFIQASDGEKLSLGNLTITVNVINVDNHQPRFLKGNYSLAISENTPVGPSVLLHLHAEDLDKDNVTYSFEQSENSQYFRLDSVTGEISLVQQLDYEKQQVHVLTAIASSQNGENDLKGYATVVFIVKDENDNNPVLTIQQTFIRTFENIKVGEVIGYASATDQDSNLNGLVTFNIIDSIAKNGSAICTTCTTPFTIEPDKGILRVSSSLDAEVANQYKIAIVANDNGNPSRESNTVWIIIQVLDINEHCPVFNQSKYTRIIAETIKPGAFILSVVATDLDVSNHPIKYSIAGTSNFVINQNGDITLNSSLPDFKIKRKHDFFVFASDQSTLPCTSNAEVSITLININTHKPFVSGPFLYQILENTPIGSLILKIDAWDDDKDILNFTINSSLGVPFLLNKTTGELFLADKLNYEKRSFYTIEVIVSDGKFNVNSTYHINVLAVNDKQPIFTRSHYIFKLNEESPVGTLVGCVLANDVESPTLNYSLSNIEGGDTDDTFILNSTKEGCIFTTVVLDRETKDVYYLSVLVYDSGTPKLTSKATIKVVLEDINDNAPMFVGLPKDVYLSEETH